MQVLKLSDNCISRIKISDRCFMNLNLLTFGEKNFKTSR